ncbi:hypothetical protein niasHS_008336 [Heterodera schachtii]|uniref:Uncharacterized protein n=1 Tax=Heterodera schachtii TaxID=97005 RepID=A0ABD2J7B1_HETSC
MIGIFICAQFVWSLPTVLRLLRRDICATAKQKQTLAQLSKISTCAADNCASILCLPSKNGHRDWTPTVDNPTVDNPTVGQSDSWTIRQWTIRQLDNPTVGQSDSGQSDSGQSDSWTIRQLDNPTVDNPTVDNPTVGQSDSGQSDSGQSDSWTIRQLDNPTVDNPTVDNPTVGQSDSEDNSTEVDNPTRSDHCRIVHFCRIVLTVGLSTSVELSSLSDCPLSKNNILRNVLPLLDWMSSMSGFLSVDLFNRSPPWLNSVFMHNGLTARSATIDSVSPALLRELINALPASCSSSVSKTFVWMPRQHNESEN